MIYFIVTTSLFNNCPIRKQQYITGINKLKQVINNLKIKNYKIIIIENNWKRKSFLNDLNCSMFYTKNNFLRATNRGFKELKDIQNCIDHYKINDNDFIVKMTGRYILEDNSEFMKVIKKIHKTNYECVIKYGSYNNPVNHKMDDCITGLIGMSCLYIKKIIKPKRNDLNDCVEWKWANVTNLIHDKKIYLVNKLGINICPGSNTYMLV